MSLQNIHYFEGAESIPRNIPNIFLGHEIIMLPKTGKKAKYASGKFEIIFMKIHTS